jgi:hypothetical protein
MRKRKSKKPRISAVAYALILALGYITFSTVATFATRKDALAVSSFTVCGVGQGTVVTKRDGSQEFMRPGDPRLPAIVKALPDKSKGVLSSGGAYCNQQKVF